MDIVKSSDSHAHTYNDGAVQVVEFNFKDSGLLNDAAITVKGRYPAEGYAVNDISLALISVESGSASFALKNQDQRRVEAGDRVLINPGEPYAFTADDSFSIRYIATPAWKAEQFRIIN
jgi:hypothetical protein